MKQEIKKGYEWYKTLTKKQQKQWRKNRHKQAEKYHSILNKAVTFKGFIYGSFICCLTPQGHNYWNNIANKNK